MRLARRPTSPLATTLPSQHAAVTVPAEFAGRNWHCKTANAHDARCTAGIAELGVLPRPREEAMVTSRSFPLRGPDVCPYTRASLQVTSGRARRHDLAWQPIAAAWSRHMDHPRPLNNFWQPYLGTSWALHGLDAPYHRGELFRLRTLDTSILSVQNIRWCAA